jgi:outer membrane protein TolC
LGVKAALYAQQAAEFSRSSVALDVRQAVRTQYFQAVQASWNVEAYEQAVKNSTERLRIAKNRFDVGASPKFDVIRLEAELTGNQAALVSAVNSVKLAKQALNNTLARPIETDFELDTFAALPSETPAAGPATELALKSRPDVLAIERTAMSLRKVRDAESRGLRPNLSLTSQYSHSVNPGPFSRADQTSTTLALSWPIFDNGLTKERTQTAEQNARQAERGRKDNICQFGNR